MFDIAEHIFAARPHAIPVSVETSPLTSTPEKLRVLRERGVDRISMGVQSFVEDEVRAVGRSQRTRDVTSALERLREAGFPTLNVDLMYGLPGQTFASWALSLRQALAFSPEEIYLYPLYVRPLTGIGRRELPQADTRLEFYRQARETLLSNGYAQVSMRMFRRESAPELSGPVYCCQGDGMIGVGAGARSYTRELHYSSEYAVSGSGVRAILEDYLSRSNGAFSCADYGFHLDEDEQRRRYVVQSLLQADGLNLRDYQTRFGTDAFADLPQLRELEACAVARQRGEWLQLNARGLECSDVIGPWLSSALVRERMEAYELR